MGHTPPAAVAAADNDDDDDNDDNAKITSAACLCARASANALFLPPLERLRSARLVGALLKAAQNALADVSQFEARLSALID